MLDLCGLIFGTLRDLLRSRSALEAEVLVLRQQIIVLRRAGRARLTFSAMDRFVLGWLCALFPGARSALSIVQPETALPMASRRVSSLLALEVETTGWPSSCLG